MATDVSIRVGVDGEKEFRSALNGINSQLKNLGSEMKAAVSSMNDMDDAEGRAAKQADILGRSMEAQRQKISVLHLNASASWPRIWLRANIICR
mgnify:CR=1 FL=1